MADDVGRLGVKMFEPDVYGRNRPAVQNRPMTTQCGWCDAGTEEETKPTQTSRRDRAKASGKGQSVASVKVSQTFGEPQG